jgi:hypothetical protein
MTLFYTDMPLPPVVRRSEEGSGLKTLISVGSYSTRE